MTPIKQTISQAWRNRNKTAQQLLDEEAEAQLIALDRDILSRELEMIEGHFSVESQKAKKAFLAQWMSRPMPPQPTGELIRRDMFNEPNE